MASLNEPQSRAILCGFLDIDRRMADLEALLAPGSNPSPFSRHVNDLSPTEARVVRDYFARIRAVMLAHLRECEIPLDIRSTSLRWALQTGISFIGIAVDELRPERLTGYGALEGDAYARSAEARQDLERLVDQVSDYVRRGMGHDLAGRIGRLQAAEAGMESLSRLEEIVTRRQLVEFRPSIEMILGRHESPSFEVAVFGRVSSGKSSFLNHITSIDALPVGVTPVTAVPTRVVAGEEPAVVVAFAESERRTVRVEDLRDYASEEGNPGNRKHVTEILVKLPSPRLREGVALVDTPGVGSLALSGGEEALAYLPRCDLGVVLVDAASTLNEEDLALLRALYGVGTPAVVLVSKADLLTPADRTRMTGYIRGHIRGALGIDLPVRPVSTVGADESLLIGWFDEELAPLLERHRVLARESLGRKIAHLRESVAATLETMLARRRGRTSAGDTAAVRTLLDQADVAVRHAQERVTNWSDDRHALLESILGRVAEVVATGRNRGLGGGFAGVVRAALLRRAETAHGLVAELREALAGTVESLGRESKLASIDTASVRDLQAGGLPMPDLDRLGSILLPPLPWWERVAPPLATALASRAVREGAGSEIEDAAGLYDRRLQAWVKDKVGRMVAAYEEQASPFREQVRRLSAETSGGSVEPDDGLEADLDELRGSGAGEAGMHVGDDAMEWPVRRGG